MPDVAAQNDKFRASWLEGWNPEEGSHKEAADLLLWLHHHLYGEFVKCSGEVIGLNFRQKYGDWLLVVKVAIEDTQQVGFVTSSTTIGCVRKLRRLLRAGELRLFPDKFQ